MTDDGMIDTDGLPKTTNYGFAGYTGYEALVVVLRDMGEPQPPFALLVVPFDELDEFIAQARLAVQKIKGGLN